MGSCSPTGSILFCTFKNMLWQQKSNCGWMKDSQLGAYQTQKNKKKTRGGSNHNEIFSIALISLIDHKGSTSLSLKFSAFSIWFLASGTRQCLTTDFQAHLEGFLIMRMLGPTTLPVEGRRYWEGTGACQSHQHPGDAGLCLVLPWCPQVIVTPIFAGLASKLIKCI